MKVCQQNRSIGQAVPRKLRQPQLQGQKVEVAFAEVSDGAFGVRRDARVPNPLSAGTSSTTASRPTHATWSRFCASQSQGRWEEP